LNDIGIEVNRVDALTGWKEIMVWKHGRERRRRRQGAITGEEYVLIVLPWRIIQRPEIRVVGVNSRG